MRAINKYLIVKRSNEEAVSSGGLLMSKAEEAEMRYQKGVVITPGTLVEYIKEGDKVYFDKVHAFDLKLDGETVTIVQEKDIVVVL
jgi:co-chaperonin GroES (HSP10)